MGIKFTDEVADPQPKSKIKFTDEPKDKGPDPSLGEQAYAGAYGAAAGVLGGLGDIEHFGAYTVPEFFGAKPKREDMGFGRETLFPTSKEVKKGAEYIGIPKPVKGTETAEKVGEIAPAAVAGGKGLYDLGRFGFNLAKGALTAPKALGKEATFTELGTKIESTLKGKKGQEYKARKLDADTNYKEAKDIALAKQGQGNAFAQSPQGQKLIKELEEAKYTYSDGKRFLKSGPEIKAIDHLIEVIKPEVTVSQRTALSTNPFSAKTTYPGVRKETQKGIEALIDELRQIREVNKPGAAATNYDGLSATYRRDLAKLLEGNVKDGKGLYGWSPEYAKADELYKAASKKLEPFETELMRRVLREEKYAPGESVKDVESFATEFFKNGDTVKQLKDATGDPKMVADLAKDYVSTIFSNKTPKEVKAIAFDPKNEGWLRESGIKQLVQDYAERASTVQNKKDVLKYLGYAGAGYTGTNALMSYFGLK
jgi:hypothetical protein